MLREREVCGRQSWAAEQSATVERREQARTGRVFRDAGRGRREAVNFPNGRLWLEEG